MAWRVNFSFGDAGIGNKLTSCCVRAVRTGQSGSSGDSVISRASYQFEEGDKPTGSVDLGDGVTVAFAGNIEVGIVDNHLGFYLGSRSAYSLMAPAALAGEAANLSFTFEEPIQAFRNWRRRALQTRTKSSTPYNQGRGLRAPPFFEALRQNHRHVVIPPFILLE